MVRKMSEKKMAKELREAGVLLNESGEYWEISGDFYTTEEAYKKMFAVEATEEVTAKKPAERTPRAVEDTMMGIAQYMSTDMKIMARWGENEVSIKNLTAATIAAFMDDTYIQVTEGMVRNTVNKWKRNQIVELTKKGWFRSSENSRFDWTTFKR